jgi:hypothetical protein
MTHVEALGSTNKRWDNRALDRNDLAAVDAGIQLDLPVERINYFGEVS